MVSLTPILLLTLLALTSSPAMAKRGRRGRSSSTIYSTEDTTYLSTDSSVTLAKKNYAKQGHFVNVLADVGFYAFEFGRKNKALETTYQFILQRPAYLTLTDCFCEGDSFKFIDNGKTTFTTNVNCPIGPYKCRSYETDPWKCLNNSKFCTGNAYMGVGAHNVTITPTSSITGGGTAFLRLDTLCEDPITKQVFLCCTTNDQCVKTIFQA